MQPIKKKEPVEKTEKENIRDDRQDDVDKTVKKLWDRYLKNPDHYERMDAERWGWK